MHRSSPWHLSDPSVRHWFQKVSNGAEAVEEGISTAKVQASLYGHDAVRIDDSFTYRGRNAVFLESESVRITVVPEKGGDILEFRHRPTDMHAAMEAFVDIDFDGPMCRNHVPTMAGENNSNPGYHTKGRLVAIGYVRGLIDSVQ